MRHLIIAILFLLPITVSAQLLRSYGVVEIGATFPTSTITGAKFAYRTVDSSYYRWVSGNTWVKIVEPSIIPDTLYLTESIGTSYKVSGDTINLTPYLLKSDTTAMLVKYIERGDTASMLSNYPTKAEVAANPTTIANNYIATSNGVNLVARNLFDNNTYVGILNSKPFMLGQWATAGRPSGVLGYKGFNTSLGYEEFYDGSTWFPTAFWAKSGTTLSWGSGSVLVGATSYSGTAPRFYVEQPNDNFVSEFRNTASVAFGPYSLIKMSRATNTNGYGGTFSFDFQNSSNSYVNYARFGALIESNTAGSENGALAFYTTRVGTTILERLRIHSDGNVSIGNTVSTASLDVFRATNALNMIRVGTSSNGNAAYARFRAQASSNASDYADFGKYSSGVGAYKIINPSDLLMFNGGIAGDFAFLNDNTSGKIKFSAGGSSTAQLTLGANGNLLLGTTMDVSRRLHVSGEVRITDLTTDTPTRIVGADADGDLGAITLSGGLSFPSSGVLSSTWLKPELEAGNVIINAASNADLRLNNLDTVKLGNLILRSRSNSLLVINQNVGSSGTVTEGAGFHTNLNGTIDGSDGGTAQIVLGGTVTANATGAVFGMSLGYASNITNSAYGLGVGYNADVTADNGASFGRNALADEIGEMSLGSDIYTKVNIWAGGTNGSINAVNYGTGTKEAADLSKTQSNYLTSFATDGTILELGIGSGLKRSGGVLDLKRKSLIDSLPVASVTIDAAAHNLAINNLTDLDFDTDGGNASVHLDDDNFNVQANTEITLNTNQDAALTLNSTANIYGANTEGAIGFKTGGEQWLWYYVNDDADPDTAMTLNTVGNLAYLKLQDYGNGNINSTLLSEYPGKHIPAFTTSGKVLEYRLARDTFIEDVSLFSVGTMMYNCQELTIVSSMTVLAGSNQEIRFPDAAEEYRGKKIIVYSKKKDAGIYLPEIKVVGGVSRLYFTTNPGVGGTDPSSQSSLLIDDTTWSDHGTSFEFTCLKIDNTPSYRWVLKQR